MRCCKCDVISLYCMYCSVNGFVYLACCVFVNCLVFYEQKRTRCLP